ncbi:MAG: HAD family phosphatase [Armatimonadota bacterium]|nr:HAD family phosphatase [Armatimonadota bacterium]MCX7777937.1 HAD family phosphatase [Armatimonadota bacterium]MDW8025630.1 HAD family phosphatase [Armatimonadota bacterium]
MGQQTLKGVIFDLDGVLVDSSEFHFQAWQIWAKRHGTTMTYEFFRETFGMVNDNIIPHLIPRELTKEELKALSDEKEAIFREVARGRIKPLKGAVELVRALQDAGYRLAIGSSTPRKNIEAVLESIGLDDAFKVRIAAEDVTKGKPEPDVFLKASAGIGVPPNRCAVIEDAVAGVEAAKRAGMRAIAVATTHPKERLSHADIVVDSIADVTVEMIDCLIECDK